MALGQVDHDQRMDVQFDLQEKMVSLCLEEGGLLQKENQGLDQ